MTRALRIGVDLCSMCALAHESLLIVVEEVGGFEGFGDQEDATGCPYYGDDAFNNIKPVSYVSLDHQSCTSFNLPSPPRPPSNSVHVQNAESDEATKSSRQRRRDEQIRNTDTQLFSGIPVTQEKCHCREQASFEEAQEDSRGN